MRQVLVLQIWRHPLPAVAAISTIAAIFLWPALPLRGLDEWFVVYANTPYLTVLYPVIAALSGLYIGLYVFHRTGRSSCAPKQGKLGATGSLVGVLLGTCPACIPVIAIFLPLTFNIFLSRIAPAFAVLAVAILLFVIYRLEGFRRHA